MWVGWMPARAAPQWLCAVCLHEGLTDAPGGHSGETQDVGSGPLGQLVAVAALGANALFVQGDAAERTAVNGFANGELGRGGVHTAGEGEFRNVELVLEQVVHDFYHALYGHSFFCYNQTAVGVGRGEFGLEGRALHFVVGVSVAYALLVVNVENGGEQWIVFTQDEGVVEVFQHFPCCFLDFVAGEYHVYAGLNGVLYFDGEHASVAVKVLGFAFETVKAVSVLQVEGCDASHNCKFF